MTISKKLVRREKYYNEICELLIDKHELTAIAGSLLYDLVDMMERAYTDGVTDVSSVERQYGSYW